MSDVEIYTDGACRGNPGPGGWGVLMLSNGRERELCGGEPETTNNRMELTAAIQGLAALEKPCDVQLYTDSKYVQHGIIEWMDDWKRRGWKTVNRKPVKNRDLWQELDDLTGRHNISWHWVKGHAGNLGNECADQLANEGLEKALLTGSRNE
jgi:ribonuclease HI